MKNNSVISRQYRGYFFELVIGKLLERNDFIRINVNNEPKQRVRETRYGFIEFKGRGCWHQIDCPYDYAHTVPFSYPLRLLGEVKYHNVALSKKHIRELIGTLKDIQENYFIVDRLSVDAHYSRKLEFGVYISANGFNSEAEKLAYAHGIKTLSYKNNNQIEAIKNLIYDFSENYLITDKIKAGDWKKMSQLFNSFVEKNHYAHIDKPEFLVGGYQNIFNSIKEELNSIKSSFIGTSVTGVFIHFLSKYPFPIELFNTKDSSLCRVYYIDKTFWLEFNDDQENRKYYFSPPSGLSKAVTFGKDKTLDEKERLLSVLYVNININSIRRSIKLKLDKDWLDNNRTTLH